MKKRKIWKSIGAIILLLMFHVDATATDYPFDGVTITINDGIAEVSLSASGAISDGIEGRAPSFLYHGIKCPSSNLKA